MKKGFQIEIQKDLTPKEYKLAVKEANEFIYGACKNGLMYSKYTSGGYRSYLRRRRFGRRFDKENNLVFRRISVHKRIFGVVKVDTMVDSLGNDVNLKQCMCPIHLGGVKVKWRHGKPEMGIYATIGDIKG